MDISKIDTEFLKLIAVRAIVKEWPAATQLRNSIQEETDQASSILTELDALAEQRCFGCGGYGHAAVDCGTKLKLDNFAGVPMTNKVLKASF